MNGVKNLPEMMWEHVDIGLPEQCWHWLRPPNSRGYGRYPVKGKRWFAHRLAYTLARGPIPAGDVVDHMCHNLDETCPGGRCSHRMCCNPYHLETTTSLENIKRSKNSPVNQTKCLRGHEMVEGNIYWRPDGKGRQCIKCIRVRTRKQQSP